MRHKDLYTFNLLEYGIRENFENLFKKYEDDIERHIRNMEGKCNDGYQDITLEAVNIFLYKLMNMVRNPYIIKDTIVIFEGLLNMSLSNIDAVYSNNIQKIINSRLKDKEQIYIDYNVSAEEYKKWLVIIYILIGKYNEEKCKLVDVVKNIFNNRLTNKKLFISINNNKCCLLSDRGFNLNFDDSGIHLFDSNLTKNIFVGFSFVRFNDLRSGSIVQEMRENGASEKNIDEIFDYIENNNKLNLLDNSIKAGLIETIRNSV